MTEANSRDLILEGEAVILGSPESHQGDWGQPSASRYVFEVDGDTLRGVLVPGFCLQLPVAASNSGDVYVHSVDSAWVAFGSAGFPLSKKSPVDDFLIEPEVDDMAWLALAESSFDFWDNEQDAMYDAPQTG